ncbi:MAG: hypothetical protein GF401_11405 [Chitinivibrionales bacterium]|nr:hypothetical protein [Chitinivibrionales bacterium]
MLLFLGCSGKGDNPLGGEEEKPLTVQTTTATGTVSSLFGGDSLSVFSVYDPQATVSNDGAFTAAVSQEGAQLVMLRGRENKIRGMTVAMPDARGTISDLHIDDTTTALGILCMSPGIASANIDTIVARTQRLKATASFGPMVDYLHQKLPTISITDMLSGNAGSTIQHEIDSLMLDVVQEYYGVDLSPALAKFYIEPERKYVGATIPPNADPEKAPVTLQNGGFRYVKVFRKTPTSLESFEMPGATGFSFGSVLTVSMLQPFEYTDTVDFAVNPKVDYWFFGPGFSSRDLVQLPSDIQNIIDQENLEMFYTKTYLLYFLFPFIEMISGVSHVGSKALAKVTQCISQLNQIPNGAYLMNQVYESFQKTTLREFISALTEVTMTFVGMTAVLSSLGLLTPAAAAALQVLGVVGVGGGLALGVMNLAGAGVLYLGVPASTVVHTSFVDTTAKGDLSAQGVVLVNKKEYIDPTYTSIKEIYGEFENRSTRNFSDLEFRIEFLDSEGNVASYDQGYVHHRILMPGYRAPFYFSIFGDNISRPWRVKMLGRQTTRTADTTTLKIPGSTIERFMRQDYQTKEYSPYTGIDIHVTAPSLSMSSEVVGLACSYDDQGNLIKYHPNQSYAGGTGEVVFEKIIAVGDTGDFNLLLQSVHTSGDQVYIARTSRTGKLMIVPVVKGTYDSDQFNDSITRTIYYGKLANSGTVPVADLKCYSMHIANTRGTGSSIAARFLAPGDSVWFMTMIKKNEGGTPQFQAEYKEFHEVVVPPSAIAVNITTATDPEKKIIKVTNGHSTSVKIYHASVIRRPDGGVRFISRGSSAGRTYSAGELYEYSVTLPDTLHSLEFVAQAVEYSQ